LYNSYIQIIILEPKSIRPIHQSKNIKVGAKKIIGIKVIRKLL